MLVRLRLIEGAPGRRGREKRDTAARPLFQPKPPTPSRGGLGEMREVERPWGWSPLPGEFITAADEKSNRRSGRKNVPAINVAA
jgi:hypothetical protein